MKGRRSTLCRPIAFGGDDFKWRLFVSIAGVRTPMPQEAQTEDEKQETVPEREGK